MKSSKRMVASFALVIILLLMLIVPASAQSTHFKRLTVDQVFTSTGTSTLTGAVTTGGALTTGTRATVGTILGATAATGIVVTMNSTVTPAGTYQPISSAGTVSVGTLTVGTAGDLLILENTANTSITISDTGTTKLTGNITLGQYDTLELFSDGTNWLQLSTANN